MRKYSFIFLFILITIKSAFCQLDGYLPIEKQNQVIKHQYYTLAYDSVHKHTTWVAYKLTLSMINATAKRQNNFRPDPLLKKSSAQNSDYAKSGYDKGHLCPAGDMSFSTDAMSETFYLSNMAPQFPNFNRGEWKKLEEQVRNWLTTVDSNLYVFTGTIITDTTKTIGNNKVAVPQYFFKIIYDYTPNKQKMIAFIMPNQNCTEPLQKYVVTVDEIEKRTGINFFPNVEVNLQEKLESKSEINLWIW